MSRKEITKTLHLEGGPEAKLKKLHRIGGSMEPGLWMASLGAGQHTRRSGNERSKGNSSSNPVSGPRQALS